MLAEKYDFSQSWSISGSTISLVDHEVDVGVLPGVVSRCLSMWIRSRRTMARWCHAEENICELLRAIVLWMQSHEHECSSWRCQAMKVLLGPRLHFAMQCEQCE